MARTIRAWGGAMSGVPAQTAVQCQVCDQPLRHGRTDAETHRRAPLEASAGRESVGVELGLFGSFAASR